MWAKMAATAPRCRTRPSPRRAVHGNVFERSQTVVGLNHPSPRVTWYSASSWLNEFVWLERVLAAKGVQLTAASSGADETLTPTTTLSLRVSDRSGSTGELQSGTSTQPGIAALAPPDQGKTQVTAGAPEAQHRFKWTRVDLQSIPTRRYLLGDLPADLLADLLVLRRSLRRALCIPLRFLIRSSSPFEMWYLLRRSVPSTPLVVTDFRNRRSS